MHSLTILTPPHVQRPGIQVRSYVDNDIQLKNHDPALCPHPGRCIEHCKRHGYAAQEKIPSQVHRLPGLLSTTLKEHIMRIVTDACIRLSRTHNPLLRLLRMRSTNIHTRILRKSRGRRDGRVLLAGNTPQPSEREIAQRTGHPP